MSIHISDLPQDVQQALADYLSPDSLYFPYDDMQDDCLVYKQGQFADDSRGVYKEVINTYLVSIGMPVTYGDDHAYDIILFLEL